MRLPNGYGSVIKLSGNRRKPFAVRITIGWKIDEKTNQAKQLYKYVSYHEKRKDALTALSKYNINPNIFSNSITFSEVYEKWSKQKFETISRSNTLGYMASYKVCESIYNTPFKEIKTIHLQNIINSSGKNYPTLRKLRVLFNQLFEYAIKNDICDKDYSKFVDIGKNIKEKEKNRISTEDIQVLWKMVEGNEYIQIILMLIYSGVRISELLELKKHNVNLDERFFFIEKSKTSNGVRKVPIALKVLPFFKNWHTKNLDSPYLVCTPSGEPFKYRNYFDSYWKPFIENLSCNYTPHSTRHTTISLLAESNINPTIIKKIVGHSGAMSLTEKVYTHFDITPLLEAIDSI